MKVNYKVLEREKISEGKYRIWLIDEKLGAKNFLMRMFEVYPNAKSEIDKHNYEHEIFVLSGKGKAYVGKESFDIEEGDAFFIPPNEPHNIENTGKDILRFICIVPISYREVKK
jgi:quercetin dioxygenase-like cupin family protein